MTITRDIARAPEANDALVQSGRVRAVELWRAQQTKQRLGRAGYVCILGFLDAGRATAHEVAEAFGYDKVQRIRELIQRMGELGLAHTDGAVLHGRQHYPVALWRAGAGPVEHKGTPCRDRRPELVFLARTLRMLEAPMTTAEVAAESGASWHVTKRTLDAAHRLGLVHVFGWEKSERGGYAAPIWLIGKGKSAPKPKPMTNAQTCMAYFKGRRERQRQLDVVRALAGVAA